MPHLDNKTALVTGASAGIGLATARLLAANGAKLVLNARRRDRLDAVAGELKAVPVPGDVTDPAVRARIIEACGGRVDILVNNAGYGEAGPVETVKEEDGRRQLEVNFFAPAALIQGVMPLMRKQRSGRIVNISSVAGRFGYPLFGWYCASKHALEGLSDALRLEARPWGIFVSLIEPGPVETEFFDVTKGRAQGQMADPSSPYAPFFHHVDEIEREMMGRAATAQRVAEVVLSACLAPRPRDRYMVTRMAKGTVLALRLLPRSWVDKAASRQFRVPRPEDVR
jgi:NAD(P)-dependent dehydrogenase (short-subunit alcohol dehydrogenase family)